MRIPNIVCALFFFAVIAEAVPGDGRVSPLWPSPPEAHEAMMRIADIGPTDVVYDLGSGTGELVAAAARRGARAIGIEIIPDLARTSQRFLDRSGLKAEIKTGDFFDFNISDATVVLLYLGDKPNLMLMPKLKKELRKGAKVVSYRHDMGAWQPDKVRTLSDGWNVYLWVIR